MKKFGDNPLEEISDALKRMTGLASLMDKRKEEFLAGELQTIDVSVEQNIRIIDRFKESLPLEVQESIRAEWEQMWRHYLSAYKGGDKHFAWKTSDPKMIWDIVHVDIPALKAKIPNFKEVESTSQ